MPAPSPDLVLKNPPALNPYTRFPFFIDEFPASILLGGSVGNLSPNQEPVSAPESEQRHEQA